jgi:hypothetical protein
MKIGFGLPNIGPLGSPENLLQVAERAETLLAALLRFRRLRLDGTKAVADGFERHLASGDG